MSELLIVNPLDKPTEATAVAVTTAPTLAEKIAQYMTDNRGYFAALLVMFLFVAVSPAAAQTEPTGPPAELGDWIMQGLFDGMDIIWGMSAIVIVLMIPAGLQFAIGILKGIVNMFSGFRF